MKSLILIKQHSCIQLAHVYEHLYVQRINDFFYEKDLFKFLDYSVQGTTYDLGGTIVVECELYSDRAQEFANTLTRLSADPSIDDQPVSTLLLQTITEEFYQVFVSDKQHLILGLKELDAMPWQTADDICSIDTFAQPEQRDPIYLTTEPSKESGQINVSLSLESEFAANHRELLPLIAVIARFLLLTASNRAVKYHGLYADELDGDPHTNTITSHLLIANPINHNFDDDQLVSTITDTIKTMHLGSALTRLAQHLSDVSYGLHPEASPSQAGLLEETGVLIGSKGWSEISSTENVSEIVKSTTLEIKHDQQTINSALAAILDI